MVMIIITFIKRRFSRYAKSAYDWYSGILKNIIKT